jgi:hypothetical protein
MQQRIGGDIQSAPPSSATSSTAATTSSMRKSTRSRHDTEFGGWRAHEMFNSLKSWFSSLCFAFEWVNLYRLRYGSPAACSS